MSAPSRGPAIGGLILAGGQNRRMGGRPKAALRDSAGVRFLDRIASALLACRSDGLLAVSCDVPLVTPELFSFLLSFRDRGWPAWAVEDRTGRLHPLCGVYMKDCLPLLLSQLEQGCRRVTQFFYSAGGQVVSLADTSIPDTALSNINTPEDWNRLFSSGNI